MWCQCIREVRAAPGVNCHTGWCRHYSASVSGNSPVPIVATPSNTRPEPGGKVMQRPVAIKYQPFPSIVTPSCDITRSPPSGGLSSDSYWYWSQYKTGNLLATKQIRKCNILDNWFTSYLPNRLLFVSKEKRKKMYVEPIRRDFVRVVEINPLRYRKIN